MVGYIRELLQRRAGQLVIGSALLAMSASAPATPPSLLTIDGTEFPAYAISLFYDDGPDVHSLELAQYLHDNHVTATFNLVGALYPTKLDAMPPAPSRNGTGYVADYPGYLENLVALHQRLSNHTLNHVPLDGKPDTSICSYDPNSSGSISDCVHYQVATGEDYLLPFISNELYTLTPPGGRWSSISDPALADYAGSLMHVNPGPSYPIGFSSFYVKTPTKACGLNRDPRGEERVYVNAYDWCYAELGLKAVDYANDLENSIVNYTTRNNRGFFVFMHDHNEGAPGTTYTLDATEYLIPFLQRHGFVFVGPVMSFSRAVEHATFTEPAWGTEPQYYQTFRAADVTGDGHTSVCALGGQGVYCAYSDTVPSGGTGSGPTFGFNAEVPWDGGNFAGTRVASELSYAATFNLADVDRDGKADVVVRTAKGIAVAPSEGGRFQTATIWSSGADFSDNDTSSLAGGAGQWKADPSKYETFRVADMNGDGYPDVCARAAAGIVCALNNQHGGFSKYTLWDAQDFSDADGFTNVAYAQTMMLADMNGDGLADLVIRTSNGIFVALSDGHGFGTPTRWSQGTDFSDSDVDPISKQPMNWAQNGRYQTFRAVDLNGDGMADICAMGPSGLVCAMSNGSRLLKSTNWENRYKPQFTVAKGWTRPEFTSTLMFADLNGDGRGDLIIKNLAGLLTEFAP